jgi:hypothetical protein
VAPAAATSLDKSALLSPVRAASVSRVAAAVAAEEETVALPVSTAPPVPADAAAVAAALDVAPAKVATAPAVAAPAAAAPAPAAKAEKGPQGGCCVIS